MPARPASESPQARGHVVECDDCNGRILRAENTDVGDALRGEIVDELVIATLRQVIKVLDANDLRDRLRLGQLLGRDRAQTDMLNQAALLEFGERRQRLFEGFVSGAAQSSQPKIDHVAANQRRDCADCLVLRR